MPHALCFFETRKTRQTRQTDSKITRFEDLKVWQLTHKLSLEVSNLVKFFPKDEKYDLANQMRRSARSVPSDISEGYGRYHFNDKLTFYERARSSLDEIRNHFAEALGNGYLEEASYKKYLKRITEIAYLLSQMMKNVREARDSHENERKSKRYSSTAQRG